MSEEFRLIDRYFLPLSQGLAKGDLGIGDDGAVISPPAHHQLVVVTDTLVNGVHFPQSTPAYDIAWKALAVNLSDLAAMGAKPGFYSLALTLPEHDPAWLMSFSEGLKALSAHYSMPLIGGDTTKGPLTVTVTAHGWVPRGKALLRGGARPGDLICVSGALGTAGLGLKLALQSLDENEQARLSPQHWQHCLDALNRPAPQLALGEALCGRATAAIDISDGLLADLTHVLQSSAAAIAPRIELGARLYLSQLPLDEGVSCWIDATQEWSLPLSAGDDYQLCFTLPKVQWEAVKQLAQTLDVRLSCVGEVIAEPVLEVLHDEESGLVYQNRSLDDASLGYQHF